MEIQVELLGGFVNRPVMSEPAILIMRVTLNLYGKLSWTLRAGTIEGNDFIPSFFVIFYKHRVISVLVDLTRFKQMN